MRSCVMAVICSVMTVACATKAPDTATDHQGLAELHIDTHALSAAGVTRVTVDAAGQTQDLSLNTTTGTFDGALLLPSGTQELVARAFAGDTLVGQSKSTPVTVQIGVITRVILRILDVAQGPAQLYGPIFDSLSFPTTTEVGSSATFTISVIVPAGDPAIYHWSSDCGDATFSAADAASTQFSKPAPGACTVSVTATSNGFTVGQSFVIAVFPPGATNGALQVSTDFVSAPMIQLSLPGLGCAQSTDHVIGSDSSCQGTIASPTITSYAASVLSWGGSDSGTLEVTDSCGGGIGVSAQSSGSVSGSWLPSAAGGTCFVTARAVNGDGIVSTLKIAVLVRAGTPATASAPSVFAEYETGCVFQSSSFPTTCGAVFPGSFRTVFYQISLIDGHPGQFTLVDDCAGPQPIQFTNGFFLSTGWTVPSVSGRTCTTTLRATTLEGSSTEVAARYQVF